MVTEVSPSIVENMHMHYAGDINEALEIADSIIGKSESEITVIPDGVSVIVK